MLIFEFSLAHLFQQQQQQQKTKCLFSSDNKYTKNKIIIGFAIQIWKKFFFFFFFFFLVSSQNKIWMIKRRKEKKYILLYISIIWVSPYKYKLFKIGQPRKELIDY